MAKRFLFSEKKVKGRWICPVCGYKSHFQEISIELYHHSCRFCPRKECSASRPLEFIRTKE